MKKNYLKRWALIITLLFSIESLHAKVKLPAILGSNMVLQQKTAAKLWGWSKTNTKISVTTSWDKKLYKSISDSQGNWLLEVNTPAAGGPFQITISDGEPLQLENILIGEVWFCSGQSNSVYQSCQSNGRVYYR